MHVVPGITRVLRDALARRRPRDVRPDRAGLRRDEPRVHDGARRALAQARSGGRRHGRATACSTPRAGPATSRSPAREAGGKVTGLDFSERMLERARRKSSQIEWVQGDVLALPFERRGASTPPRSASGSGTSTTSTRDCASSRAWCGRAAGSRCSRSRGRRGVLRPFFRLWFDVLIPLAGKALPGGARLHATCPRACVAFPAPTTWPTALRRAGFADVSYRLLAGGIVSLHVGRTMKAQAVLQQAEPYPRRARGAPAAGERQAPRRGRARGNRRARRGRQAAAPAARPPHLDGSRARASRRRRRRARAHGDARARRPGRRCRAATGTRGGLARARRRSGPGRGRLPLRERVRRARRGGRPRGRADPRGHVPRARARRGAPALPAARRRHDRGGVLRAHRAEDREALRGGLPARLARRAARAVRARARDGVPDRRRHPRLLRRHDRDRQGRRAPTCARARRRCRCSSRRARTTSCAGRSPAGRSTARSCALPRRARSSARGTSRSTTRGRRGSSSATSPGSRR